MTDKLFDQETPEETPEAQDQAEQEEKAPTIDPEQVLFKVGDREYNAESAAKDIAHKQAFIDQIMKEKRDLEERYERENKSQTKLDEALELLKQKQQIPESDPSQETETVDTESLMEQLRKMTQEETASTIARTEQERKAKENLAQSVNFAREAYGDAYQEKLTERREALGMSQEEAENMATSNPQAFRELFAKKAEPAPAPQGSRNSMSYKEANKGLNLPRITGHWSREKSVHSLREAEQELMRQYKQGKLEL